MTSFRKKLFDLSNEGDRNKVLELLENGSEIEVSDEKDGSVEAVRNPMENLNNDIDVDDTTSSNNELHQPQSQSNVSLINPNTRSITPNKKQVPSISPQPIYANLMNVSLSNVTPV